MIDSHTSRLKVRYVYIDGIRAQRIAQQVNVVPCAQSLVLHQRTDVAYLVPAKAEVCQAGQIDERRDKASSLGSKIKSLKRKL